MISTKPFKLLLSVPIIFLACGTSALAADVTLAWDANSESNLAGYLVYYGTASGTYGEPFSAEDQPTAVVTNLTAETKYFFAVAAYNTEGQESDFSNEVDYRVPPPPTPTPTPSPTPPPQYLLNLSTRVHVLNGDSVMIGGFIIAGDTSKSVVIRALGPSLLASGLQKFLHDPVLELYDSTHTLIAQNDNWTSLPSGSVPAELQPADPKESVIMANLAPGRYTGVLRSGDGTVGHALCELYDLEPDNSSLRNMSTRGEVGTDDEVMIGGFIIGGRAPAKVIVRAIGPSLAAAGVADALPDPVLELHDSQGSLIFQNDNWRAEQEKQIVESTIPPTDDRESAIVATLSPGSYTAIIRDRNNGTGVALVEVYDLRDQ